MTVTADYIQPVAPAPLFDDPFENFLHNVVVGVTAIDGDLVRPRWVPGPPNIPALTANWIALGVEYQDTGSGSGVETLVPAVDPEEDVLELQTQEKVKVNLSFYGPGSAALMGLFRDGIQLSQNRYILFANGIGHIEITTPVWAPEKVKEQWRKRIDTTWIMLRQIRRTYEIKRFASASGIIYNERYETPFSATDE